MTRPLRRDGPILAFMAAQTAIWASIFYSFPGLVLAWQAEFGWSSSAVMGAFSLSILIQGLAAPWAGRLLDQGRAPRCFGLGAVLGAAGLLALSQVQSLAAFYAVWAVMGVAMAMTLYDACFALVTRARGGAARDGITAITLAAGFASTLSYPLAAALEARYDWQVAVLAFAGIVVLLNLPLATYAARALEQEARGRNTETAVAEGTRSEPATRRPGFWPLALGFAGASLGSGIVMSHLFPLLAALGITGALAVTAASVIGPSQVAGRVVLMTLARQVSGRGLARFTMGAMALAVLCLAGAGLAPGLVFAFAVLQGLGYGIVSIMRPVLMRDVFGERDFGQVSGKTVQGALFAFAAAPGIAAILADTLGYGAVLALCAAAYLAALLCFSKVAPGQA